MISHFGIVEVFGEFCVCLQQAFNCSKCERSWFSIFLVESSGDGAFCRTNKMLGDDQQEAYLNGRGRFERLRCGDDVQQLTTNPMRLAADELLTAPLTFCFSAAQSLKHCSEMKRWYSSFRSCV